MARPPLDCGVSGLCVTSTRPANTDHMDCGFLEPTGLPIVVATWRGSDDLSSDDGEEYLLEALAGSDPANQMPP